MSIGSRTHEEFMEEARAFHGYPAPGLIIGGYMVELAKRHMPEGVLYDAVSETAHCLPDAVQLLTPCTFGNGWLRVLPFGIYAVTLYDKATGEGVRVELDNDKLEPYDAIRSWFLKEREKAAALGDRVLGVACDLCGLTDQKGNNLALEYRCTPARRGRTMTYTFEVPLKNAPETAQVELYFGVNEDLGFRFEQDARLLLRVPLLALVPLTAE